MRVAIAGALIVAAAVGWWLLSRPRTPPPPPAARVDAGATPPTAALEPPRRDDEPPPPPAPPPDDSDAGGVYPVDLARLRERLPDNSYWELAAPTSDPEVARRRAERARRLNDLYGKVLSGTGTEEEIRAYFDERKREHEDMVAFATAVLEEFGAALPDRDRGLYELSIKLHAAKLEELPRRLDEALARKAEQDRKRQEWERQGKPQ